MLEEKVNTELAGKNNVKINRLGVHGLFPITMPFDEESELAGLYKPEGIWAGSATSTYIVNTTPLATRRSLAFQKQPEGMTRFVGEAIGHRKGQAQGPDNRRKKMEAFLEGKGHEDIELAQRLRDRKIPELPEHDPHRSFVFMDVSIGKHPAGRLIIELFDDVIPVGATHLRNRCLSGSHIGLAGCEVTRHVPHYASFLGKCSSAGDGIRLRPSNELRALDPGTVSISMSGDEVAISLARALCLDTDGYQVVGRVWKGKDVIEMLNEVSSGPDSVPYNKITVTKTGATNSKGDFEGIEGSADRPTMTSKEARQKLKEESASARSAVLEALDVALGPKKGSKRKAEEPEQGVANALSKVQSKGGQNSKSQALNLVLGEIESEESD